MSIIRQANQSHVLLVLAQFVTIQLWPPANTKPLMREEWDCRGQKSDLVSERLFVWPAGTVREEKHPQTPPAIVKVQKPDVACDTDTL